MTYLQALSPTHRSVRSRHRWLFALLIPAALTLPSHAQSLEQQQEIESVRRQLNERYESAPEDIVPLLELVRLELTIGEHLRAIDAAARVEAVAPDDPRAILASANALAASGAGSQALAKLERALEIDPDGAATRIMAALILRDLRRIDEAIALLVEVHLELPDDPEPAILLGFLRLTAGDPQAALELAVELAASEVMDSRVDQLLGLALAAIPGRRPEAVDPLIRALGDSTAGRGRLRIELIDILIELDRIDEAIILIEDGLAETPDAPQLHYRMATALRASGDLEGAAASLQRHQELQSAITGEQDLDRARQTALDEAQALALDNRMAEALDRIKGIEGPAFAVLRSKILFSQRQPKEALAEVIKARLARPGWAEAHYLEGLFLSQLGRLPEATVALRRAAAIDSNSADIAALLATTLNRQNLSADAIPWFERALELGAEAGSLRLGYADALEQVGRSEDAARQLEIWRRRSG